MNRSKFIYRLKICKKFPPRYTVNKLKHFWPEGKLLSRECVHRVRVKCKKPSSAVLLLLLRYPAEAGLCFMFINRPATYGHERGNDFRRRSRRETNPRDGCFFGIQLRSMPRRSFPRWNYFAFTRLVPPRFNCVSCGYRTVKHRAKWN